jgi:hypothetical protein
MLSDVDSLGSPPIIPLDRARECHFETEPHWGWTDFPEGFWDWIPDPKREAAAKNEKAIVVDCWKYRNNIRQPDVSQVRYIDDDQLETWAKQPVPTQDGEAPRAGLRLVHICIERCPFPKEILVAIAEAFGIPRVDLSDTCRESGVCATIFTQDRNHPGVFPNMIYKDRHLC